MAKVLMMPTLQCVRCFNVYNCTVDRDSRMLRAVHDDIADCPCPNDRSVLCMPIDQFVQLIAEADAGVLDAS